MKIGGSSMRRLGSALGPGFSRLHLWVGVVAALLSLPAQIARAEGGVSFWIPGFFGSLAAVPAEAPGMVHEVNLLP